MSHVHVAQRRIVQYICRSEMNRAVRRSERNRACFPQRLDRK